TASGRRHLGAHAGCRDRRGDGAARSRARAGAAMRTDSADVLVIGSGIAGLSFALKAARRADVCVVTKKERAVSSTNYAQGGIAAVMSPDDSLELHVRDTLVAGAGLCHLRAVESLVREGPERVHDLVDWGVRFSADHGDFSLGREGRSEEHTSE